jgi:hypothetical protein
MDESELPTLTTLPTLPGLPGLSLKRRLRDVE